MLMSRLRTDNGRTECEDRARILKQNSQKVIERPERAKVKRMRRTDGNVKFIQKDFHGVSCSPLLHSKVYNLLQSCFKFHRRHQTLPIMSRSIAQENIFSW